MQKPRASALLAEVADRPRSAGRSPLYVWMRANHAELLAGFQANRPDWKVLAEAFAKAGLTDRGGNPPKPETARKTWQTVRKDAEVSHKRAEASSKPSAEPEPPKSRDADEVIARLLGNKPAPPTKEPA